MPKKKKHKQSKPFVKKSPHLMYGKNPDNSLSITWTLGLSDSDAVMINDCQPTMYPMEISDNNLLYATIKDYSSNKGKHKTSAELKKEIDQNLRILSNAVSGYLSDLSDINQHLNKYTCQEKFDKIDLRQYVSEKELFKEAFHIINEIPDVTMLFSPSETFDIQFTDAMSYRVTRCIYDHINMGVRYCFIEYQKILAADNTVTEIPTYMCVASYDIVHIKEQLTAVNEEAPESKAVPIKQYTTFPEKDNFDIMVKQAADPNNFYAVRVGDMGAKTLMHMLNYVKNNTDVPKIQRKTATEMLLMLINNQYGAYLSDKMAEPDVNRNQKIHYTIAQMVPIAAIIITNYYLRQKALSKPLTDNTNVLHEAEIILENRPERKTRVLGNTIKITTEKRPVAMTKDKLIKYHTPEWSRKSHLRRLKSGKVVEIKSQTCKRRCVDLSNVTDKRPKPVTDYIVKADVQKGENKK